LKRSAEGVVGLRSLHECEVYDRCAESLINEAEERGSTSIPWNDRVRPQSCYSRHVSTQPPLGGFFCIRPGIHAGDRDERIHSKSSLQGAFRCVSLDYLPQC
jgi:hypothetical protein